MFACFAINTCILLLLLLLCSALTVLARYFEKIFPNPEDYKAFGKKSKPNSDDSKEPKKYAPAVNRDNYENSLVARVKRMHLNNLENIVPAIIASFLHFWLIVQTKPVTISVDISRANTLFTAFTVSRIAYSLSYLLQLQPWRFLTCFIGGIITAVTVVYDLSYALL